ncbi:MAG: ribosome maturation factor RimP [Acidimicrobiia bacterium]
MTDPAAIEAAVEPVLGALGLDVYDVEVAGSRPRQVVRVKVDREGGVDMDAVTDATRAVSDFLDEHDDLVDGRYTLEVSSPGIERDLRRPVHFERAIGATVSVKARTADGPVRMQGVLRSANGTGFTVAVDATDHQFSYDDVTSVRTVFEWEQK